jgi:hypothetical protein
MAMKILKLDRTGHSTLCGTEVDLNLEFATLTRAGYAMFLDDVHIKELPTDRPTAEILALAPLVGG